jgi:transposase
VFTLDRAGWHTTRKLQLPSNISLVPLPPASPELNPTENIYAKVVLSNRDVAGIYNLARYDKEKTRLPYGDLDR